MRIGAGRRLRKFFNEELTDEMIWDEIIHEKNLSNLIQLKTLSTEAAEALIKQERRMELLSLGIVDLPEGVARALAKYEGEILLLNCVKEITPKAAGAVGRYAGFKLGLEGLKRVSVDVMKGFAPYKGILMLNALEDIPIDKKNRLEAEKTFRQFKAGKLCFNSIKQPSFDLLRCFAKTPGQLELNGISELSPAKAAVLVSHKGSGLKLKGLAAMPTALARMLLKYKGFIDISGVTDTEHAAIKLLAEETEERFMLSRQIKTRLNDYKRKLAVEKRKKRAALKKLEEAEKEKQKKAEEVNFALLEEFEKFDQLDLVTAETIQTGRKPEAVVDTTAKADETVEQREARLNSEIIAKKNQLNALQRKGLDNLSDEENQQVAALKEEIERLKDDIKEMLDLLIEEREVGTVVFGNSDDLVTYLKESGAEDDENDALAKLDDFDLFGGDIGEDESDDIDIFGDKAEAEDKGRVEFDEEDNVIFYEVPKE
jgi:hypothetical protein